MGEIKDLSQLLNALKRGYTVKNGEVVAPKKTYAAHGPKKAGRHFCISVAGHTVGIDSMYEEVFSLCENYLCDDEPEILISMTDEDIRIEHDILHNAN